MLFLDLELCTRYKIYTQTKKILRKYQKGIISGKLTSEQFVSNMVKDRAFLEILDEAKLDIDEFTPVYRDYVDTLITIQNETLNTAGRNNSPSYYSRKASLSSIFKLNQFLSSNNYKLSIPAKYLSEWDVDCIVGFVRTGDIEIGNEKIYKYIELV